MAAGGITSFLKGNRVLIDSIPVSDAKKFIGPGMTIRTNYDNSSGTEGTFSHWEDETLIIDMHMGKRDYTDNWYINWENAQGRRGIYIECNPVVTNKKAQTLRIDDVILNDDKKSLIRAAVSQVHNYEKIFVKWGFEEVFEKGMAVAILMWGPPGTGKTIMCQAIANELELSLEIVQAGDIWSSEPGAAERTIKEKFEEAKEKGQLLLFDECDSLIADRNEVGMILGAQINTLLSCLENYEGVVCFTTNRLGTMDPAFERRVAVKVEFPFPTQEQRLKIWNLLIPTKAPINKDVSFEDLSFVPIAGGNIKNVILNAARMAAFWNKRTIDRECFAYAIEKEGQSISDFEANINSKSHLVGTCAPSQKMVAAEGGLQVAIDKFKEAGSVKLQRPRATVPKPPRGSSEDK